MSPEEHAEYHKKLIYIFGTLLIILFGGALFYHTVEKWEFIDSLYFTAATMTTVGYGDITPQTFYGKVFTIFYMFISVGIALYGLSMIGAHFVEQREEYWLKQVFDPAIKMPAEMIRKRVTKIFNSEKERMIEGYNELFSRKKKD